MPPSPITLAEDVHRLANERAAAQGYGNVSDYVAALIRDDTSRAITPELESHLLKALQVPAKEIGPAHLELKRKNLRENRA